VRSAMFRPSRVRVAVVCALAGVLTLPATEVRANPDLEELRRQTQEAEQRHERSDRQLRASEERLETLQADFSLAVEEYNQVREDLAEVDTRQAALEAAVADLTVAFDEGRRRSGDLVRDLYKHGGHVGVFETLLGASGPTDTARRHGYLRSVQRKQHAMLERFTAQRLTLERRTAELAAVRARQLELAADLEERRVALEAQVDEQGREIAELERTVASHRSDLRTARTVQADAEQRIELERQRERERQRAAERQREAERQEVARADRSSRDSGNSGSSGGQATTTASSPSAAAQAAVQAALGQVGVRYRWGGSSPSTGFDCSGLTSWAYRQAGVTIPRTSRAQYAGLPKVSRSELRPGDLLFFNNPISHVGMYIGNGQMVEAPYTGTQVRVRSIQRSGYVGAARPTG
jgi:peptidoglycan DL-endopeptidase CwlO